MKLFNKILTLVAVLSAFTLGGCATAYRNENILPDTDEVTDNEFETDDEVVGGDIPSEEEGKENGEELDETGKQEEDTAAQPVKQTVTYIKVTGESVNLRTGAGVNYTVAGAAEKDTLYTLLATVGGWYKTYYKNSIVYISAKYCVLVQIEKSDNELVEAVIAEGTRYMGVKYVYGATRYHDGGGNLLSGFTATAFDCSSLMQYIFKKGAGINLQVTTRTQVYQGKTVAKSQLKRGDLIFFTNASRKNNTGVERIGHVALYLGDNLILHTASDYAKIEQISSQRWSYYIQTQRMI